MFQLCLFLASGVVAAQAPTGDSLPTPTVDRRAHFTERAPTKPAISVKVNRYAKRIIRQYDRDGNGTLDQSEWKAMHGRPQTADLNRDLLITVQEFAEHVGRYGRIRRIRLITSGIEYEERDDQQTTPESIQTSADSPSDSDDGALRRNRKFFVPNSRLPKGLPRTFLSRDLNGDGQLTLSEFAPKAASAELKRFKQLDANLDGVVTAREYMRGPKPIAAPEDQATEPPAEQK